MNSSIQEYLFRRIKEKLPVEASLADVVAEMLHVSNDSAYRRIRGETPLILEEAQILCEAFSLSLDQTLNNKENTVSFTAFNLNNEKNLIRTPSLKNIPFTSQGQLLNKRSTRYTL